MKLEQFDPRQMLEQAAGGTGGDGWRRRIVLQKGGAWVLRLVALAAVLAAGAWAYWANFGPGAKQAMDMGMRVTSGTTPFPVTVAPVERGPVRGTAVYTGSVAPFNEEDIYPRVTGRIVEMPVYPGDAVRAGQVVARLDDVELSSRVREAEAMAATAQANRAQMEADVVAAQHGIVQMDKELAMVEAELTYARAVAARSERLVGSGAISRQEYENDRSMATALEAKREAARAKLEQARAMELSARKKLEAADAMVAQGRAALRTATVVRDYVTILAPSTGYVVKRHVAPGVLVQPGMAILKLAQIDRVRLQANVGEKDVGSIRVGSPPRELIQSGMAGPPSGDPGGSAGWAGCSPPNGLIQSGVSSDGAAAGSGSSPAAPVHIQSGSADGSVDSLRIHSMPGWAPLSGPPPGEPGGSGAAVAPAVSSPAISCKGRRRASQYWQASAKGGLRRPHDWQRI